MRNKKIPSALLIIVVLIVGMAAVVNYGFAKIGDPPEGTPTPTSTPTNDYFSIDSSNLKDGTLWVPYSGVLTAKNIPQGTTKLLWRMTDRTMVNIDNFGLKCGNCLGLLGVTAEGSEISIVSKTVNTPKKTGLVSGTFDLIALKGLKTLGKTSINFEFYIKEG